MAFVCCDGFKGLSLWEVLGGEEMFRRCWRRESIGNEEGVWGRGGKVVALNFTGGLGCIGLLV